MFIIKKCDLNHSAVLLDFFSQKLNLQEWNLIRSLSRFPSSINSSQKNMYITMNEVSTEKSSLSRTQVHWSLNFN